ncbi:MAG: cytochrome c3 family protein [Acidobacteriota bacterium]
MAVIFPRWANRVPGLLALGAVVGAGLAAGGYMALFTPAFTDVGYRPRQPIPFSHALHSGELKIDCRYCHATVEVSTVASLPPTRTCMNCHRLVSRKSEKLALLRESDATGQPIHWIRVHKVPEFAYFTHSAHIRAGVGCSSCHGDVSSMERIEQVKPLGMGWCLDCHRDPARQLRPRDQITNTRWTPPRDQERIASRLMTHASIKPSTDCTTCHR